MRMVSTTSRYLVTAILLTCLAACGTDPVGLASQAVESDPGGEAARTEEAAAQTLPTVQEVQQAWRDFVAIYNEPDPRQRGDLAGLLAITDAVVVARATTIRPFYSIPMGPGGDPARTSSLTLEVETIVAGALVHQRQGTIQVTLAAGVLANPLPPSNLGGQRVVVLLQDREAEARRMQDENLERYAGQYGFTSGQGLFVATDRGLVTPLWLGEPVTGADTDSVSELLDSIEAALPADFPLPVDQRAPTAGSSGG